MQAQGIYVTTENVIGLSVVFSFPPSRSAADRTSIPEAITLFVNQLAQRPFFEDQSITWNAPAAPIMDRGSKAAAEIRSCLHARGQDQFVPMGLTGALHQLLTKQESTSEIDWAVSNPWRTGCGDAGFEEPAVVLLRDDSLPPLDPTSVPVARPALLAPPRGARSTGASTVLAAGQDGAARVVPTIDLREIDSGTSESTVRGISRALRRIRRAWGEPDANLEVALLVLSAAMEAAAESGTGPDKVVAALLGGIETLCERGTIQLRPLPAPGDWRSTTKRVVPRIRPRPANPDNQSRVAQIRKKRASRLTRREALEAVATGAVDATALNRPTGLRDFDAIMMGDVVLAGPAVDARFRGGHFAGFDADSEFAFPTTRSFLRVDGIARRARKLETITCFSYESDETRGIRTIQRLSPGGAPEGGSGSATFVSDFSFVSNLPVLVSTHALSAGTDLALHDTELIHLARGLSDSDQVVVQAAVAGEWLPEVCMSDVGHDWEVFGTRFRITHPAQTIVVAFLTATGLPLMSSVGVQYTPKPVLAMGGRFTVTLEPGSEKSAEFALVMASGPDSVAVLDQVLSGRMPAALQRELNNGPGFIRPLELKESGR